MLQIVREKPFEITEHILPFAFLIFLHDLIKSV